MFQIRDGKPLRCAIAGIGGFASSHHRVFAALEERAEVRVVATCDPALPNLGSVCETYDFSRRGVACFTTFEEMMQVHGDELDLAVIATPIPLHASMHAECVRAGIACYLEKPPTLDPAELDEMLSVEAGAKIPTHVGFAYIDIAEQLALKSRSLAGDFGLLKRISLKAFAQRPVTYYQRNSWAGKLTQGDRLVLDSCCGNAMAHHVNLALFHAGQAGQQEWARPLKVKAELYRANAIEGADTVFAICTLENGVELRLAVTHACANRESHTVERLEFERALIEIRNSQHVTMRHADGRTEAFSCTDYNLANSVSAYLDFLRGRTSRPAQRLIDCRGFVETDALFYLAAGAIHNVTPEPWNRLPGQAEPAMIIPDIEKAAGHLLEEGLLPSEARITWSKKGGEAFIQQISGLRASVQAMKNTRPTIVSTLKCDKWT